MVASLSLHDRPLQTEKPSSREEEDQLLRSAKKIKNVTQGEGGRVLKGDWPALGEPSSKANKVSFVDKLKGVASMETSVGQAGKDFDTSDSDDSMSHKSQESVLAEDDFIIKEDPNRNFPEFIFSSRFKKRLYSAWDNAVIVKLLGRSIGFKALESRLQAMWAKRGIISLIDIGCGFFIVKLSNHEDYTRALVEGPWLIYDHYLTVRPWEPKFRFDVATIDKVAVWIRFPKVFMEYYDEEALSLMGNRIGKTIKVDVNTSCQLRGHYARVCVLVDLTKQLPSGFTLEGEEHFLEYEGLHMLCANCGIYGHRADACLQRKNLVQPEETVANNQNIGRMDHMGEATGAQVNQGRPETWKVVQKSRRTNKQREKASGVEKDRTSGSRFGVLAEEHDQGTEDADVQAGAEGLQPEKHVTGVTTFIRQQHGQKGGIKSNGSNERVGERMSGQNEQYTGSANMAV